MNRVIVVELDVKCFVGYDFQDLDPRSTCYRDENIIHCRVSSVEHVVPVLSLSNTPFPLILRPIPSLIMCLYYLALSETSVAVKPRRRVPPCPATQRLCHCM